MPTTRTTGPYFFSKACVFRYFACFAYSRAPSRTRLDLAMTPARADAEHKRAGARRPSAQACPRDGRGGQASASTTHARARTVQPLAPPQHLLDVGHHDLLNVSEVLVELVHVALCPRVHVQPLRLLDEGVELDEGVRSRGGVHFPCVQQVELLLQLLQVVECEPLWVGALSEHQVAHAAVDDVAGGSGDAEGRAGPGCEGKREGGARPHQHRARATG